MPPASSPAGLPATSHAELMDGIYRWQRHVYDATRKYYLFGRDPLLRGLALRDGQSVLEIGCGTGRNLAVVRRLWPAAHLHGIDISAQMIKSARCRLGEAALLACADATDFAPEAIFGRQRFDRIILPYCLSMIPPWRETIGHAATMLAPGGSLHIVDFGDMAGLPRMARHGLRGWLARFHVAPRAELAHEVLTLARTRGLVADASQGPLGYYQRLTLTRPGLPGLSDSLSDGLSDS